MTDLCIVNQDNLIVLQHLNDIKAINKMELLNCDNLKTACS